MNPHNAKVKKTILGKYEVTYDCPGCGQNLKNSLDDAGIQDSCPHCEAVFKVPGLSFKQKMEKEAADQAEAKRLAEEQKEAEKKAKEAAHRHNRELAELAEEQERKKAERLNRAMDSELKKSGKSRSTATITIVAYSALALTTIILGLEFVVNLNRSENVMHQAALGAMYSAKFIASYIFIRCVEKILSSIDKMNG